MRRSGWGTAWRYLLALVISGVIWGATLVSASDRVPDAVLVWLTWVDPALGLLTFVLIRWRHRHPAAVAITVNVVGCVSASAVGPASWAVGSLASHRRWRLLAVVGPLSVLTGVGGVVQEWLGISENGLPIWVTLVFGVLVTGILLATGYAMGSQRELVESYRDRAVTAEREQQARVAQAQAAERTRIAREMHDVLAHRISLVAMNAGTLSYRTDLSEEERGAAARSIEDNAHRALSDLRAVLGVLRDPTRPGDGVPERPQPGIEAVAGLVAEEAAGGMRVRLTDRVAGQVPAGTGRTVYRVVQEALTNVRKHATGTTVSVELAGTATEGITVEVGNARPVSPTSASTLPASGLGLIGLAERVSLAGGRFTHGTDTTGGYAVRAWIPWDS